MHASHFQTPRKKMEQHLDVFRVIIRVVMLCLVFFLSVITIQKRGCLNYSIMDDRITTIPFICDRCRRTSIKVCTHLTHRLPRINDARLAYREQLARDLYTIHSSC